MNIKEFDKKYGSKGGYAALKNLLQESYSFDFIADHFGVESRQIVSEWAKDLFPKMKDPKKMRKERAIESMLKFAKKNKLTEQQFRDAYYYASRHYMEMALVEGHARKVFGKDQNGRQA